MEDGYLATDDEGDDFPGCCKDCLVAQQQEKDNDARQRVALAKAREVASRRIEKHERNESDRVFSLLDNISEANAHSFYQHLGRKKRNLSPSHNPFIDFEAVEVGDDDSDIVADGTKKGEIDGDSSFINDSDSDEQEDKSLSTSPPSKRCCVHGNSKLAPYQHSSDHSTADSGESEGELLYEDFSASREVTLRSIWRTHNFEQDSDHSVLGHLEKNKEEEDDLVADFSTSSSSDGETDSRGGDEDANHHQLYSFPCCF